MTLQPDEVAGSVRPAAARAQRGVDGVASGPHGRSGGEVAGGAYVRADVLARRRGRSLAVEPIRAR